MIIAEVSHPIPSRTRSLNPLAPMVLCLKTRKSRSSPVPLSSGIYPLCAHSLIISYLLSFIYISLFREIFFTLITRRPTWIPSSTRSLNLTPPMVLCLSSGRVGPQWFLYLQVVPLMHTLSSFLISFHLYISLFREIFFILITKKCHLRGAFFFRMRRRSPILHGFFAFS